MKTQQAEFRIRPSPDPLPIGWRGSVSVFIFQCAFGEGEVSGDLFGKWGASFSAAVRSIPENAHKTFHPRKLCSWKRGCVQFPEFGRREILIALLMRDPRAARAKPQQSESVAEVMPEHIKCELKRCAGAVENAPARDEPRSTRDTIEKNQRTTRDEPAPEFLQNSGDVRQMVKHCVADDSIEGGLARKGVYIA